MPHLPLALKSKLHELQRDLGKSSIIKAHEKLSERYRKGRGTSSKTSKDEVIAYALARLPATYAALKYVLCELKKYSEAFETVLDFGAGPGTSIWAFQEIFHVKSFTLVEKNLAMLDLGKQLLFDRPWVHWHKEDLRLLNINAHDLVLMSYSLGEFKEHEQNSLLQKAWTVTNKAFVIVEPGTPKGYQNIMRARDFLIKSGAHILAPCPHNKICPLSGKDWCHFSITLSRTEAHRSLKGGSLMMEDEKFSYLIAVKEAVSSSKSRVIKSPIRRSGHVIVDFCTQDGIKRSTFSKKDPIYRQARALSWGDEFDQ